MLLALHKRCFEHALKNSAHVPAPFSLCLQFPELACRNTLASQNARRSVFPVQRRRPQDELCKKKQQKPAKRNVCFLKLLLILVQTQARLDVVEVVEVVEHRRGLGLGLGLGTSRPRRRGPRRLRHVLLLRLRDELES